MNPETEKLANESIEGIRSGARTLAEGILKLSDAQADWAVHEELTRIGLTPDLLYWAKDYRDGKLSLDGFAREVLRYLERKGRAR